MLPLSGVSSEGVTVDKSRIDVANQKLVKKKDAPGGSGSSMAGRSITRLRDATDAKQYLSVENRSADHRINACGCLS